MATWIVSGGNTALDDALNRRNGYIYTNGDTILVKPGVYSPIVFNGGSYQNISVIAEEGRENTIIDGGGVSACLRNNNTSNARIYTFEGFSLSNGFVSTDVSAAALVPGTLMEAGAYGSSRFIDCGFYDCSAFSLSADINNRLGITNTGTTTSYPSYTYFKNCEISGNVSNTASMFNGHFLNCDIHHNCYYRTNNGDRSALNGIFYGCRIHHNETSGLWEMGSFANCLIYKNHGNNIWLGERNKMIQCTFANNDGILHLDNSWGGRTHYKNCVFYKNFRKDGVTRSSASWGSSYQGTININNYFDQLSTTMTWHTPMTSTLVSGDAFLPGVEFGFVDEENDDYHLRPDSILISAGTNYRMSDFEMLTSNDKNTLTALERYVDLFGNTDFEGKAFDSEHPSVGAYQFQCDKQNLPNKLYPLGRESSITKMVEVEYIEFQRPTVGSITLTNPAAIIDTGIVPTPGTSFEMKIKPLSCLDGTVGEVRNGVDQTINGTRTQFGMQLNQNSWGSIQAYGTSVNCEHKSSSTFIGSFDYATRTLTSIKVLDGTTKTAVVPEGTDVNYTNTFTLFGRWIDGNRTNPHNTGMMLWYCKIWQNEVLVRDMVPVRIGSVGYLWDKVTQQLFAGQGGGIFTPGPDKNPLYDAEVEYLESTGTQYIDTGIGLAAGSFRCHASVDTTYTSPCNVFVLVGDATSGGVSEGRVLFLFQGGGDGYIDRGTAGGRISFSGADYDTGKIAFSIQLNAGSTKHFGAFGAIGGNSAYFLRGKMYLLQIWDDNGALVRDFIPVRKNGVGYLYDKVSNRLFGNAGAGDFILGPDKTT